MMNIGNTATASLVQTMKGLGESNRTAEAAQALKAASLGKNDNRAIKAAEDFEAVFISEMLKPMFNMIEVDETFGGGKGEEVFRDIMVQEYGKMIAKQGGIGLAQHIKDELIKIQEHGQNPIVSATSPTPTPKEATHDAS